MKKANLPEDMQERVDEMKKIRESRRTQEEIISELGSLIKDFSKLSFLPYVMGMMDNIDQRNTSDAFKYLMSPMKQFVYLIDLYFSIEIGGIKEKISEEDWMKITMLLSEIEMTYFGDIGFFNDGNTDEQELEKISVSLQAFMQYFSNAQLSYEEQTFERFEKNCGAFETDVKRIFGFTVEDAITFSIYIRNIINQKLTDCNYYSLHPEEWTKLTSKFTERGVSDPQKWGNEPELAMFKEYTTKPGYIFIHNIDEIKKTPLADDIVQRLFKFLIYHEDINKGTTIYYADKNPYFDTPLITLDANNFLWPHDKILIECFYNRINAALANEVGEKYKHFKNLMLEKKVKELFQKLFGKDVQIFISYYFDINHTEQDILIRFKKTLLIIEVKDSLFRAPMRDPFKAFEKIKSDFKKSIQYGYDQCKRVEDKIADGNTFKIFDHKTKKLLYEIIPSHIDYYYSIVVTQFKYGSIQTNLDNLLIKEEDELYPWSVCVDDLEAFILILKKIKKGIAASQFIEYLKYREPYNEHLVCADELEMCGYFMNDPTNFKNYAFCDTTFASFPGMADMFDAEYHNGLGFDNELDIDIKKYYKPKYRKDYKVSEYSGEEFRD
jgi:hypothetical protein